MCLLNIFHRKDYDFLDRMEWIQGTLQVIKETPDTLDDVRFTIILFTITILEFFYAVKYMYGKCIKLLKCHINCFVNETSFITEPLPVIHTNLQAHWTTKIILHNDSNDKHPTIVQSTSMNRKRHVRKCTWS